MIQKFVPLVALYRLSKGIPTPFHLEDIAIKEEPKLFRVIDGILNIKNKKIRNKNFFIKKGRLYITKDGKFEDTPSDLLELFIIAEKENVLLSPDIVQQITRSIKIGRAHV